MIHCPTIERRDFEELLAQYWQLIQLANDLEFQLYSVGDNADPERVQACQQSAGALIKLLREFLFRHDQQVLPILENQLDRGAGAAEAARFIFDPE